MNNIPTKNNVSFPLFLSARSSHRRATVPERNDVRNLEAVIYVMVVNKVSKEELEHVRLPLDTRCHNPAVKQREPPSICDGKSQGK